MVTAYPLARASVLSTSAKKSLRLIPGDPVEVDDPDVALARKPTFTAA